MNIAVRTFLMAGLFVASLVSGLLADEIQVPFDKTGNLMVITADQDKNWKLFPEFPGMTEARLYEVEKNHYILEIYQSVNGTHIRKKLDLDQAALDAFRLRLNDARREKSGRKTGNAPTDVQEGKIQLITASTAFSIYYGIGLSVILNPGYNFSYNVATGVTMLSIAGGFFIPFFLFYDKFVSEAQGYMYFIGSATGIAHSLALQGLYAINAQASFNASFVHGMNIALSIGEAILAFNLVEPLKIGAGDALLMNNYQFYGAGMGLGIGFLMMPTSGSDYKLMANLLLGGALLGDLAGFAAGYTLSRMDHYTTGDAVMLYLSDSLSAAWSGVLLSYMPYPNNADGAKLYALLFMGLYSGGKAAGHFLIGGKDFTLAQSGMTLLGTTAGSLVSLGLAYVIGGLITDSRAYLLSSALGATLGYGLMYYLYANDAKKNHDDRLAFNLNLSAEGLIAAFADKTIPHYKVAYAPILKLDYRF